MSERLVVALAALLAPGVAIEAGEGAAAIDADTACLRTLLGGPGEREQWRLWTNPRCLVTTRQLARRESFARAAAASAARGWPVHVRASGGATVVHRPGILNLSLITVRHEGTLDIARGFGELGARVIAVLARLGLDARMGAVPGSYCDGRFNIVAHGRKIAGTACLLRPLGTRVGLIAHAALTVTGDVAADVAAVARFEGDLGIEGSYEAAAHVSLAELLAPAN